MKTDSKLFRLVVVSPWPLLIFLVIPLFVVLSVTLHMHLPLAASKYPLLINNACFSLIAALRFACYAAGFARTIRYGAGHGVPREALEIAQPDATVARRSLAAAGYRFGSAGNYAEKRDYGYLGTLLLYAGLFIAVFTGTLDNMRQFSGTLLDSIGLATNLNQMDKYRNLITGPFTTAPTTLPKMKIVRQLMPDKTYPRGATEVAFRFADGKERQVILKAPDSFQLGAYDIYMSKMVYEPKISIMINDSSPVFVGSILLDPLVEKENGYGFYGAFTDGTIDGQAFYQPEQSRLRVILRQGALTYIDSELIFQVDRDQTSGNVTFTCEKMGVWSELHVVRRRHMPLILFGGLLVIIGLLMRIAINPQRVWLEDAPEGSRVRCVGAATKSLVNGEV